MNTEATMDKATATLDMLTPGGVAVIKKIHMRGPVRRRLMDMGLVAGTEVEIIRYAPLGDPIEIKVKNYFLSVRKEDAQHIGVEIKKNA